MLKNPSERFFFVKDQGTGYHKEKRWSAFAESCSAHGKNVAQSHVWHMMIKDISFAMIVHDKKNCQNTNQIEADVAVPNGPAVAGCGVFAVFVIM